MLDYTIDIEQYGNFTNVETKEHEVNTPASETVGAGVPFERTRRITGYLVGTVDRFCNAKACEVRDRVKHS